MSFLNIHLTHYCMCCFTWQTALHVPRQRTVRPTHCMSGPPPGRAPRRAYQRLTAGHVNNPDPDSTPHTSASSLQSAIEAAYAQCHSGAHWLPNCLRAQLWTHASFAPQNTVTLADVGQCLLTQIGSTRTDERASSTPWVTPYIHPPRLTYIRVVKLFNLPLLCESHFPKYAVMQTDPTQPMP
jgi:hypothetical protein